MSENKRAIPTFDSNSKIEPEVHVHEHDYNMDFEKQSEKFSLKKLLLKAFRKRS